MRRNALFLALLILLSILFSGCTLSEQTSIPAAVQDGVSNTASQTEAPAPTKTPDAVSVHLYAEDYLGKTKLEIDNLLGGFVQEEYYNGGNLFMFSRSNIWFGFGCSTESFSAVPDDAKCEYILSSIEDAADFKNTVLAKDELESALNISLVGPEYSEMDDDYSFYGYKGNVLVIISCAENGLVSKENDYIIYKAE